MHLSAFHRAQSDPAAGFDQALREIRAGGKRGHWIWYVFPQLAGLGTSAMSREYGIRDLAEAEAYLRDPLLGRRLAEIGEAVLDHVRKGTRLERVMGSAIDARKVISSLTLFGAAAEPLARDVPSAERVNALATELLRLAEKQGYPPCAFTRAALDRGIR
jgi:uncharacterized protein (DUF1810 family)